MVGVPGRSKGCETCRKRKKGCDRKRPCSQCVALGLACGGYERPTVFLNRNQATEASSTLVSYRKQERPGFPRAGPGFTTDDIVLPYTLTRSAYSEKYIGTFLADYFPSTQVLNTASQDYSSCDCIGTIYGLDVQAGTVHLSLLALSLFSLGQRDGDASLKAQGLRSYGYALTEVSRALSMPSHAGYEDALAASMTLSLFEMMYGGCHDNRLTQSRNWLMHLKGQIAIMKARGPLHYRSGSSHQLFVAIRYLHLFSAIKDRKHFSFNSHEWRTIPWELIEKSHLDKLLDLLADMTEVVVDTDSMRAAGDPALRKAWQMQIQTTCWELDEQLRDWLEQHGPLKAFYSPDGRLVDPNGVADVALAHRTVTYWATLIILYTVLASISNESDGMLYHQRYIEYTRALARSLPYFWLPGAGKMGTYLATFPLGMCMHLMYALDMDLEEKRPLEQLLLSSNVRSTVLQFLNSLQRDCAGPELAQIEGVEGLVTRARTWLKGKQ
ncbi:hypothetical protein GGR56DRAFT_185087 [Xylariaceae sp. FL0804]|nr:hypothetical protein GGR56DRAFT_185087 [Xylariaceae sp. FL0804]